MEYLWGILIIVGFVGVYILFFALNERTKVPEGCELPEDFEGCGACHSATCGSRKKPEQSPEQKKPESEKDQGQRHDS